MAKMFPEQISGKTESRAERLLFHELEFQLDNDFIVMHGVSWLSRNRRRNFDGEADFVIIHPDHGVLVLEVKGGTIEGEWSSDTWFTSNRTAKHRKIRNPIKQALQSMFALKTKLEDDPRTRDFHYPMFRGVAFPDVVASNITFGAGFERTLMIDSSNLTSLKQAVREMYGKQPLMERLPPAAIQALLDLLQPIVQLTQIGLLAELKEGELVMTQLTEQQFRLLGFLRQHRQVVINGCAGSGKTMLAIEKARLLAEQGFEVLLTCFNRNLADWMRSGVELLAPEVRARIRVNHYHDLAVQLCEEAGRPSAIRSGDSRYWDVELPAEFEAAAPFIETRFDAIIADEGQDFAESWWRSLTALLRDPEHGAFYIFQDEQQAIYRKEFALPFAVAPHELGANCRSTSRIHDTVVQYYGGDPKPESLGPEGRSVELLDPESGKMHETIGIILERLVDVEGLQPDQIVILTPNGRSRSRLKQGDRTGAYTLSWEQPVPDGQIRVSSVHAFKGLESAVVILAESGQFSRHRYPHELAYVALSRARHHLVILGALPEPLGNSRAQVNQSDVQGS